MAAQGSGEGSRRRPWDDQPNPPWDERETQQKGGRSRLTTTPQRVGILESGALPKFSDHRRIVPLFDHSNPTTQSSMFDCEDTPNHSTTYNSCKLTRITDSTIHGDVTFHSSPVRVRTYKSVENLVRGKVDWNILHSQLVVVDQDEHQSRISALDRNEPNFFWITKNMDFTDWESAGTPRALLVSAPNGHGRQGLCRHIIDRAKEKASYSNGVVLHFFGSSAAKSRRPTSLIHTLLHQVVCASDRDANSIAEAFLCYLVYGQFQRSSNLQSPHNFREDDSPADTVQKILVAPDNELIEALADTIKQAGIQEVSLVVDGVSEEIAYSLFELIREATPQSDVLITSQYPFGSIPRDMIYIEHDKERKECLRLLRHDDTRYDKISEEHHNSLGWLWEHPQYQEWSRSKTSSLLYIEGKPGSGKSTLAKYFKKQLAEKEPNARFGIVAHYFYTLRGSKLEQTHANMLRSLLYSILEQDESTFYLFQREFRNIWRPHISEWPYGSLKKILSAFAGHPSPKPLYLILDAMDESDENDRRDIVHLLWNLCLKENPCIIKVFLTSRPVAQINDRIQNLHHVIQLQDQNTGDISRFADDFLTQNLGLSGEILHEARDYITDHAEGVFVWVRLVKNELEYAETGYSDAEILHLLKALPPGLEMFYEEMFSKLENSRPLDVQLGIRLFRLILFSLRPFTLDELRDALAVPDDLDLCYEQFQRNKIREIRKRIEHCGRGFLETKGVTVQFMHQTVREFLIRTIPGASNVKFDMREEGANRVITATLVRYLKLFLTSPRIRDFFSKIEEWIPSTYRTYAEYLNEWPLMEYALRHMKEITNRDHQGGEELQSAAILSQQLAGVPASSFLGTFFNSRHGENSNAVSEDIKYNTLNAATESPELHHSKRLLLTCTENQVRADGRTPLMISAQKRLPEATRLFLERTLDKDAQDNDGRTALHYAAENCDDVIARLLLEKGASKHKRDTNGMRACEVAVDNIRDNNGNPIYLYNDTLRNCRNNDGTISAFTPNPGGKLADPYFTLAAGLFRDRYGRFRSTVPDCELPLILRILNPDRE